MRQIVVVVACRGRRVMRIVQYSLKLQMSTYVWKSILRPKNFLIVIGKSKSSLHGLTSSDFSPTTDTWQWLLSFQHFRCTFCILGIFSKTGKTRVSHRVKMMTRWPGREGWPKWPIDPVTKWPSSMSGLNCYYVMCARYPNIQHSPEPPAGLQGAKLVLSCRLPAASPGGG